MKIIKTMPNNVLNTKATLVYAGKGHYMQVPIFCYVYCQNNNFFILTQVHRMENFNRYIGSQHHILHLIHPSYPVEIIFLEDVDFKLIKKCIRTLVDLTYEDFVTVKKMKTINF